VTTVHPSSSLRIASRKKGDDLECTSFHCILSPAPIFGFMYWVTRGSKSASRWHLERSTRGSVGGDEYFANGELLESSYFRRCEYGGAHAVCCPFCRSTAASYWKQPYKDMLTFDRPKAKAFKAVGKLSSMMSIGSTK
jgi:hypothetical protein